MPFAVVSWGSSRGIQAIQRLATYQHSKGGYQSNYLQNSPKREEESGKHNEDEVNLVC